MKWASGISEQSSLTAAIQECAESVKAQLGGETPHFAALFVSPHHRAGYDSAPEIIRDSLGGPLVLGCSGGGIIGSGKEVEQRPAVSVTAACLPDVELVPFHLAGDKLPDLDAAPNAWEELLGVSASQSPQFVLLADPFSFPAQNLLLGLDYAFSKSVKIGGLASGGQQPNQNALFLGNRVHRSGAIGVALHGNITVDTVVAQGCRPIGQPLRISECRRNVLLKLNDDHTPLEVLRGIFQQLAERDRELMRNSLFLGVVMDEFIDQPQHGDFLIRNVVGLDSNSGALAVGEMLKEGQLVQFHLRDAQASAQDLTAVLERYAAENRENQPQGALLFSCLGRGAYLYGRPNHDTEIFQQKVGEVPLGGFFCNGEIGPVSGATFLHGYTSSFGIFRPRW